MAIENGYATLAEWLEYAVEDAGTDTDDDALIEDMIEAASRFIDEKTQRTFYARTETRNFDVPPNKRVLILDDELLSLTSLTNGDSSTIATGDVRLYPLNNAPYSLVKIKSGSNEWWKADTDGDKEEAIKVEGSWGFSTTAPADVKQACMEIVKNLYGRRFGAEGEDSAVTLTVGGVVIEPTDISAFAASVIAKRRRIDLV